MANSMKKLILSASLALSVAVVGNIFVTHQAHATFFAPRGQTQINYGTGVDGKVCSPTSLCDSILIDQGQTVGWKANLWNSGDLEGTTKMTVKNRYFDGTYSTGTAAKPHAFVKPGIYFWNRLETEPLIIAGAAGYYYYGYNETKQSWDTGSAAVTSPTRQEPGSKYCRVVMVNPAGANYIPWIGASSLATLIPPFPPIYDYRNSTFWPGNSVGPLGPTVPGDAAGCAIIAYNYDIAPSIESVDSSGLKISNPGVTITPTRPTAPGTDTDYTQWIITQVAVSADPGDNGGINNIEPCNDAGTSGWYKTKYGNCRIVAQSGTNSGNRKSTRWKAGGTLKDVKPANSPTLSAEMNFDRPPNSDGKIICYVLSVNAWSLYLKDNNAGKPWRHSRMVCPEGGVTKKPRIQVKGDDARVGGRIDMSDPVQVATKLLGSWGEYASYSTFETNNYATASGFGSATASKTDKNSYSLLTFANSQSQYGTFAERSAIASPGAKNVVRYFENGAVNTYPKTNLSPAETINLDNPGGLSSYNKGQPVIIDNKTDGYTLKITGGTIHAGQTYVIIATGRVEISGNISYDASVDIKELKDIPQLVIVAHDIDITDAVSNIDAWLITPTQESASTTRFTTPGTINTCSSVSAAADLTTTKCSKQLTINGPVVTDKLLLWRTAGGGDTESAADPDPAEKFNNRGDAYLWALNYLSDKTGLKTTNMIELPPRY